VMEAAGMRWVFSPCIMPHRLPFWEGASDRPSQTRGFDPERKGESGLFLDRNGFAATGLWRLASTRGSALRCPPLGSRLERQDRRH